jgi:3'5'-cyclic nucleotide phosphodiesterase
MHTYWCEPVIDGTSAPIDSSERSFLTEAGRKQDVIATVVSRDASLTRLVAWNVEMFEDLLVKLEARRTGMLRKPSLQKLVGSLKKLGLSRDEGNEIKLSLPTPVSEQLATFLLEIISAHRPNTFHNIDRMCNIAMCTKKLLDKIADEEIERSQRSLNHDEPPAILDPLTQFALSFAALIRDVNHPGACLNRLVEEVTAAPELNSNDMSALPQRSIDFAWSLLMESRFADLRQCIYSNESELSNFRDSVVNAVLTIDFNDADVMHVGGMRFEQRASYLLDASDVSSDDCSNRNAAAIASLISKVSYVCHTMQHFTLYKKWTLKHLTERYQAYQNGCFDRNPIESWYAEQLSMFDDIVIPLARQLEEYEVFGAARKEYLGYAKDNRLEWETNGREIIAEAALELGSEASVG